MQPGLMTKHKRKLKNSYSINRRGLPSNYDPYSFILDE
jgi:hypothetical protein